VIELVMGLCLISNPGHCTEKRLQFSDMTLSQCNASSMVEVAKFIGEHPQYAIAKWHCEEAGLSARL